MRNHASTLLSEMVLLEIKPAMMYQQYSSLAYLFILRSGIAPRVCRGLPLGQRRTTKRKKTWLSYYGTCLSWAAVCVKVLFILQVWQAGSEGSYLESILNALNDVVMLKQVRRLVCAPCIWCVCVCVCVAILLMGTPSKTLKRIQSTKHLG